MGNFPCQIQVLGRAVALGLLVFMLGWQVAAANPYDAHYYDAAGAWRSNCVWWVWHRWREVHGEELPSWGNAGSWSANAQAAGYPVDATPAAGSIVVTWESPLGHVAFVEAVDPHDPSRFLVSEYGFASGIDYHERWLTTDGSLLFIHPRADPVLTEENTSSIISDERSAERGDGTGGP